MLSELIQRCFYVVDEYSDIEEFAYMAITAQNENGAVLGSVFMDNEYNITFAKNKDVDSQAWECEALACSYEELNEIFKSACEISTDIIYKSRKNKK